MLHVQRTFDGLPKALNDVKHTVYKREGERPIVRIDTKRSRFKGQRFQMNDYWLMRKIENLFIFCEPKERMKVIFE